MKRKWIGFLLLLTLALLLPVRGAKADGATIGTCGEHLTWSYDADSKVLTISGTGEMEDYGEQDAPWHQLDIYSVIVEDGVTSIGNNAFYGYIYTSESSYYSTWHYSNLMSVRLPQGLKRIGNNAFAYNHLLTAVDLPEGLTTIEYSAFWECRDLTQISLPKSLKSIGSGAFSGSGLTSVHIPASLTSGAEDMARNLYSLKKLTADAANSAYSVKNNVLFSKDGTVLLVYPRGLSTDNYTVPAGVKELAGSAFHDCKALKSVQLPSGLKTIGGSVFSGCTGLTTINLPSGLTTISSYAFSGCTSLTTINLPSGLTAISSYAFSGCTGLTEISIPAGVTSNLQDIGLDNCENLASVTVADGNANYSTKNGVLFNKNKTTLYIYPPKKTGTSYTLPSSVTTIKYNAFRDNKNVNKVVLPSGLQTIEGFAFENCSNLTTLELPDGLTEIGNAAFGCCSNLTGITIPETVTSIGYHAFYGCQSLTHFNYPQSVTTDPSSLGLSNLPNLSVITVAEGNTAFAAQDGVLFSRDLTELLLYPPEKPEESYTIPETVTSIDSFRPTKLKNVTILAGVTESLGYYLKYCTSLQTITVVTDNENYSSKNGLLYSKDQSTLLLYPRGKTNTSFSVPAGVTRIGWEAFKDCEKLTKVTLPDGLKTIESYAFENCIGLTSINLPEGLTSVGDQAFAGCTNLKNIVKPSTLTDIGWGAFPDPEQEVPNINYNFDESTKALTVSGNGSLGGKDIYHDDVWAERGLKTLTVEQGITGIVYGAFKGCRELTSVSLPTGLKKIAGRAFHECMALTSLTLPDGLVRIESGAFDDCTGLTQLNLPVGLTSIGAGYGTFSNCTGLTQLALPEGLTELHPKAFTGCINIALLKVPSTLPVTVLENSVFWYMKNLKTFSVSSGNTSYSVRNGVLFSKDGTELIRYPIGKNGTSYTVPDGVTKIHAEAFLGCSTLQTITLPSGLKTVGNCAFSGCSSLKTITLPSGLKTVGNRAFLGCSSLKTITLPSGLKTIGKYAFGGCLQLTKIVLPEGVTAIDKYVFDGCDALTSVTIPSTVTSIASDAFYYNHHLRQIVVDSRNKNYASENGVLFNKAKTKLLYYPQGKTDSSYAMPDTVAKVVYMAFEGSSALKTLQVPAAATAIDNLGEPSYSSLFCYGSGLQEAYFVRTTQPFTFLGRSVTAVLGFGVTAQPQNVTAEAGDTVTFRVNAIGSGLKYQWQYKYPDEDWKNSGFTSAKTTALSFTAQEKYNGLQYRCIITDGTGKNVTSVAAVLTVESEAGPTITVQPKNTSASVGATAKFTVTATGTGLKYQWQYKYPDGSWTNSGYTSAKTAALSFAALAKYNGLQYRCIITDANGKKVTSSAATLTITPKITAQPKAASAAVGATAKFTVTATGAGLKYQWQYKYPDGSWTNSGYNSAKTATLSFAALAKYNGLQYRCIITDENGKTVTSSAVTLTITPVITAQPKAASAAVGATAKFTVTATGAGLKYQWQYKYPDGSWTNSGYNSAKTAALSFAALAKYNGLQYRCIITDANGAKLTSSAVKLTITPKITAQPKNTTAAVGGQAKFTVTATGAGLKYQWQYKYPDGSWTNSGYSSAKTATLSFAALAKYNGLQYRCIITDANGKTVTSSAATLTVK